MSQTFEQEILELEEKYHFLADNLIDAIWVVDAETMTYDYVTASIQRLSGYSAEELIGRSLKDRMSSDSFDTAAKVVQESMTKALNGIKLIKTIELELLHKNGGAYWIEVRAKIHKNKDGKYKIIGVSRDITQRKQHERIQKELVEKLNKTIAEKDSLLKENKTLREILPICSGCKRIRDENDRWWPLDVYVEHHTRSNISHTICPDCYSVMYEDI